jgi:hypothetical protein
MMVLILDVSVKSKVRWKYFGDLRVSDRFLETPRTVSPSCKIFCANAPPIPLEVPVIIKKPLFI